MYSVCCKHVGRMFSVWHQRQHSHDFDWFYDSHFWLLSWPMQQWCFLIIDKAVVLVWADRSIKSLLRGHLKQFSSCALSSGSPGSVCTPEFTWTNTHIYPCTQMRHKIKLQRRPQKFTVISHDTHINSIQVYTTPYKLMLGKVNYKQLWNNVSETQNKATETKPCVLSSSSIVHI